LLDYLFVENWWTNSTLLNNWWTKNYAGELLLLALALLVLGVRVREALFVQADFAGVVVAAATKQRKHILAWSVVAVCILLGWLSGHVEQLGSATMNTCLQLSLCARRLTAKALRVAILVHASVNLPALRTIAHAIGFVLEAWRGALRAYIAELFMHGPRLLGGLQLPGIQNACMHTDH
jgi:hypothetical protein